MKTLKITGIKQAVGDFNNWQGAARIYFDKSDGKVWTMIYSDSDSYNRYHSSSIEEIYSKDNFLGRDDKVKMVELRTLCEAEIID